MTAGIIKILVLHACIFLSNAVINSKNDCTDGSLTSESEEVDDVDGFYAMENFVKGCVCVFPFIFEGGINYDVITVQRDDKELKWCSCTENYDENRFWGVPSECVTRSCSTKTLPFSESEGFSMTDPNKDCVFPYTYKGMQFVKPTKVDYKSKSNSWCGTTSDVDADGMWGEVKGFSDCLPEDGQWNSWGEWSACSVTCDSGEKTGSRTCNGPFDGGQVCPGESTQTGTCNEGSCNGTTDGSCLWSEWGDTSSCSTTCGSGVKTRKRILSAGSGPECSGDIVETSDCINDACPDNCEFGPWSSFSSCSKTCGDGVKTRTRTEKTSECTGSETESENCSIGDCSSNLLKCYTGISGHQYYGGEQTTTGEITLDGCLSICSADTACKAIDYNLKMSRCYTFSSIDEKSYRENEIIIHYAKNRNFDDADSGCTS